MTSEISDNDREQIIDALFAGRKIDAIKIYRTRMGTDLKTAHDFIRELEARLRAESPEKFARPSGIGCSATTVIFLVVLAMFAGGCAGRVSQLGRADPGAQRGCRTGRAGRSGRSAPWSRQRLGSCHAPRRRAGTRRAFRGRSGRQVAT